MRPRRHKCSACNKVMAVVIFNVSIEIAAMDKRVVTIQTCHDCYKEHYEGNPDVKDVEFF